jgi:uncharacterized protein
MTTAFVDASAWIALALQRDSKHRQARSFFRSVIGTTRLVTSNYVLGESLTFLAYRHWRRQAIELHTMIHAAIKTNLLGLEWVTAPVHDQAWSIFERYDDQQLSFCDCTSFAICFARNVDFVFGFDRNFEVVGLDLQPRG